MLRHPMTKARAGVSAPGRKGHAARWCMALMGLGLAAGQAVAGVYAVPAQKAAEWLESQQDVSDGSWLDTSSARTFLQTSEAVMALHLVNRRRAPYYAAQTWIENHDPANLDARARRLVVLRATQSSAQPDIDALLAGVGAPAAGQTGWGLAARYRASALDTALVLDALRTAGATFSSASTITYLKATQLTTAGELGWAAAGGAAADAYTTAKVVQALAPYRASDATLATPLANAVATLKLKVTTTSAPHVRAATALAYLRMDPASTDARTLLNSLVAQQRTDGGFDAGVFTTGIVVQAMAAAEGVDASTSRERVDVIDAALRRAINESLGRGAMDQLNRGELAQLTTLNAANLGITSVEGLQYATNLTSLNLQGNNIASLAPLSQLTAQIDCHGNPGCIVTSLAATYSPSVVLVNKPVTFTATLTGGNTNGKLSFGDGTTVLATNVALNASGVGSFTTSALTKGPHTIIVAYSGDYNHSSSAAVLQVEVRDLSWLPAVLDLILE